MRGNTDLKLTLELTVALSVVITLIVLIVEVRTNTRAIERQSRMEQLTMMTQPFHDDVEMGSVLVKVKAVDGIEPLVAKYMKAYDLTELEAIVWSRHQWSIWGSIEADFLYSGSGFVESTVRALLPYPDNQLYWEVGRESDFHSAEFIEFVDSLNQE